MKAIARLDAKIEAFQEVRQDLWAQRQEAQERRPAAVKAAPAPTTKAS